jgi:hypothetical protein
MSGPNTDAAIVVLTNASVHVQAARRNLIGKRLPLSGWHTDIEAAERDIQAARQAIDEALALVQQLKTG